MHTSRILHAGLLFVTMVSQASPAHCEEAPQGHPAIMAALQPFVDRQTLAGAVALVADGDKVLTVNALGFADVAVRKGMRPNSLFWIASMSKTITAAAVMMLVDAGRIHLDDPVEKYLPEFNGQMVITEKDDAHILLRRPAHPITVRNVLSHTSGLPFKSALEDPTLDALPLAVAVRSYAMTSLMFEPDTQYQYSNAGINTAARVLEVVSGMKYEDFMQKQIFDPLGMKDTTFWPTEAQLERLASAYKPDPAKTGLEKTRISQLQYPLSSRANRHPMPAGGLFSTAGDVARFCQMLLRGGEFNGRRLLSADAVKEMSRRQTAPSLKQSYGLGCTTADGVFGHGGALATDMAIDTQRGLLTVWLVQHAGFPYDGAKAKEAFKQAALTAFAKP